MCIHIIHAQTIEVESAVTRPTGRKSFDAVEKRTRKKLIFTISHAKGTR